MNIELVNILRYAHGLIYWKDHHSVYLGCNNHVALLAGLSSPEEIIGKTDYDLTWREQAATFQKDDSEIIRNGLPKLNIEEQFLTAQGNIETFISNKVPLKDAHGKTIGILGVSTEVTQLKNMQQQLQLQLIQQNDFILLLLNQLPCYVFWKNKIGVYLGCNDAFAQSLGFATAKDIIGKTDYDLPTNEGAASYQKDDQLVMESRQPKINIEEEQVFLDGTKQSILTSKVPLYEDNDVIGVLGVYSNITELKKTQEQLQLALAEIEETNKAKTKQALVDCALQVSHDIRSPLAALNTALRYMPTLPEDQRIAIRHAVNRINDIANNLLIEYRDEKQSTGNDEGAVSGKVHTALLRPELLSDILDALLSEKKMSMGNRRIELNLEIADSAFGVFVWVDAAQMKRMLSNIVNNALEAMGDTGQITLRMQRGDSSDGEIQLDIVDTGKGIPAAVLGQIQQAGGTHGKVGGTGIGVASAMALVREYGGSFNLASQEGVGTTVSIRLPIVATPSWFQSVLNLKPGTTVVVLDDDESIHSIWTTRCHAFLSDIQLEHVYGSDAFREYIASRPEEGDYLHLMDYELLGSAETGLDLIESLQLSETAILVTSRYEEAPVRERAARLGVKMIPKNFSPYIPIAVVKDVKETVAEILQPELVFLDDDETLTDMWKRAACFEDRFILTFNSTRELRRALDRLQKNTPIYIDSNLHESVSGQVFAKELYDLGFTELYLASGYPAAYFGELPWIKGFVGKEPPF